MKLRLIPILLLLVGAAGIVLYATTPVVMVKAHYVREIGNTDLVQTISVDFGGNGEITMIGTYLDNPNNDITLVAKDDWSSESIDVDPYPNAVVYLSFVGLGLAFLGMFLSIFGYSNGLRIAGALLAIIGGGLGIAGSFILYNWNLTFQEECKFKTQVIAGSLYADEYTLTYKTFGPGWLATVISSGLIAFGSVFLLLVKPKK